MWFGLIFLSVMGFANPLSLDARHELELTTGGTVIARRLDAGPAGESFFYRTELPISARNDVAQLLVVNGGQVFVLDRRGSLRALEEPAMLTAAWFRRLSKIMRAGGLASSVLVFGQLALPHWLDYSRLNPAALGVFVGAGALSLALMRRQNPAAFWTAFTESGMDLFPRVLLKDVDRIEDEEDPRIVFFDGARPPIRLSEVIGDATRVSCAQRLEPLFSR